MKDKKSKNYLLIFFLLLIIFLMPLVVAFILYNKNSVWLHHKTVNKGIIISSNVNLNLNLQKIKLISAKTTLHSFYHNWFVFYLVTSDCRELCQKNLHALRQITLALGKYRHHVNYGLILVRGNPLSFHSLINKDLSLLMYIISKPQFKKSFSVLNIKNYSDGYFIADPFGKIILYYPSNASGEDIYQDLMRLLTISTPG